MNFTNMYVEVRLAIANTPQKDNAPEQNRSNLPPEEENNIYGFLMTHFSAEIDAMLAVIKKKLIASLMSKPDRSGCISSGPVQVPPRLARAVQQEASRQVLVNGILTPQARARLRVRPRMHGA